MTAGPDGRAEDRLDAALVVLRQRARARNAARVEEAARLLGHGADDAEAPSAEAVLEAAALCHAVAGSAGTFGDDDTTAAARELEAALRGGDLAAVPARLERLRALTDGAREGTNPES